MMKTARLTNRSGVTVAVHTTTDHPDCHYGQAVWVDDENTAYLQVGLEHLNPFYRLDGIESVVDIGAVLKSHGIRQAEAARRMGVTPATFAGYCQRGQGIGVDTLQRIADAIGCDITEFF